MAEKIIELSRSYQGHGAPVRSAVLREPTGWAVVELGDPVEVVWSNQQAVIVRNAVAIRGYLERFLDLDDAVTSQLVIEDIRRIERALRDFFMVPAASPASSTRSGSGMDETSTPSAD